MRTCLQAEVDVRHAQDHPAISILPLNLLANASDSPDEQANEDGTEREVILQILLFRNDVVKVVLVRVWYLVDHAPGRRW